MDFFDRQERARRNTKLLAFYFFVAVILIVAAVYLVVALIFSYGSRDSKEAFGIWNPELFLWVGVGTLGVILIGSLFKTLQISSGGGAVATMLGGRPVNTETADLDEQRLINVVEEMAIASGTPVPEIYILDDEQGINAFAAGLKPTDAAIGVTRGCIRLLNRDELQGVIAHEFSHILNGDMRLNLRLIGLLSGILGLAIIGRVLLRTATRRTRSSREKGGNPLPILGLGLLLVGSIGVFFGKLIKSAISRQREFLADAAAVQFTRNPDGIGGALKKIGGLVHGSRLQAPAAEEASHLFFGNGLSESWMSAFSTHPPLADRIRAIDPAFDGKFPRVSIERPTEKTPPAIPKAAKPPPIIFPVTAAMAAAGAAEALVIPPQKILADIGSPGNVHLAYAADLLSAMPDAVRSAAHEPFGACALVYGLLLSQDAAAREQQIKDLGPAIESSVLAETRRLSPLLLGLDPRAKLPLVDMALPALRKLSPAQYEQFRVAMRRLIESDQHLDLFEFCLEKILRRHLDPQFRKERKSVTHYYAIVPLLGDCAVLISALARLGHAEPDQQSAAFRLGASRLPQGDPRLEFLPLSECNLSHIDTALDRLAQAALPIKRQILDALAHAIAFDGKVEPREAELLRAVADTLDCPMPPFTGPSGG